MEQTIGIIRIVNAYDGISKPFTFFQDNIRIRQFGAFELVDIGDAEETAEFPFVLPAIVKDRDIPIQLAQPFYFRGIIAKGLTQPYPISCV